MKFIINGSSELEGEIKVLGSKNAATPVIAATILTSRPCLISNVPKIRDVATMLSIIQSMGGSVDWLSSNTVRIVNRDLDPKKIDMHLIRRIRSSILLIGPILARFGSFSIGTPGGCHIGARPLDAHIEAFKGLGVGINYDETNDIYHLKRPESGLGNKVILKEFSVTATENLMMLGAVMRSLAIDLAATEPHVENLGNFLRRMGVKTNGLGAHNMRISGSKKLNNGKSEIKFSIMNDPIEAGTFMVLGALAAKKLVIKNAPVSHLVFPLLKFKEFGADFYVKGNNIIVRNSLKKLRGVKIQTLPYPGFPTDLQAPFGVLATQSRGETLIFDTLYEGRLRYIKELIKMGARAKILDPHRAVVFGRTPLRGATIKSLDLRAGATLVIAALSAKGRSVLHDAEEIDRGYERLEERLRLLGAKIERVN